MIKKLLTRKPNHNQYFILFWWICFLLILIGWMFIQTHQRYIISFGDTFFHAQRIYEIRMAFLSGHLPGWVNFLTFHNVGQAINGMYPDLTLWPLVLLTNTLKPINQIIVIRTLISLLSFVLTFLCVEKEYSKKTATMVAFVYTLSGMLLQQTCIFFNLGQCSFYLFYFL